MEAASQPSRSGKGAGVTLANQAHTTHMNVGEGVRIAMLLCTSADTILKMKMLKMVL